MIKYQMVINLSSASIVICSFLRLDIKMWRGDSQLWRGDGQLWRPAVTSDVMMAGRFLLASGYYNVTWWQLWIQLYLEAGNVKKFDVRRTEIRIFSELHSFAKFIESSKFQVFSRGWWF